ncbi:hypothetical protein BC832DRAFT_420909 [Gaertneriomyces semiglobifer]|nr:hypothetical protein BC832DRAFT_420909 [Gaertneriomyces semiglobifer]
MSVIKSKPTHLFSNSPTHGVIFIAFVVAETKQQQQHLHTLFTVTKHTPNLTSPTNQPTTHLPMTLAAALATTTTATTTTTPTTTTTETTTTQPSCITTPSHIIEAYFYSPTSRLDIPPRDASWDFRRYDSEKSNTSNDPEAPSFRKSMFAFLKRKSDHGKPKPSHGASVARSKSFIGRIEKWRHSIPLAPPPNTVSPPEPPSPPSNNNASSIPYTPSYPTPHHSTPSLSSQKSKQDSLSVPTYPQRRESLERASAERPTTTTLETAIDTRSVATAKSDASSSIATSIATTLTHNPIIIRTATIRSHKAIIEDSSAVYAAH